MATHTQHIHVVTEASTQPLGAAKPHGSVAPGGPKRVLARLLAVPPARFVLHCLEMQIAMEVGMGLFSLLRLGLRASPAYEAAFAPDTDLWILGHALSMTAPMVAWMIFRGHGWQHSVEMGASMIVPAVLIIVLGWLGAGAYLPWLRQTAGGLMAVSMLAVMLVRYKHFSGHTGHAAQLA